MYRTLTLALLALTSTGCYGRTFLVDERLTPDEERSVLDAEDRWIAAGAEPLAFIFRQKVDVTDAGNVIVRPRLAHAAAHEDANFEPEAGFSGDMQDRGIDGIRIIIPRDVAPEGYGFNVTIVHELGHVHVGRTHARSETSVMYFANEVLTLSDEDKKMLARAQDAR